jgi:hypothetical protein
MSGVVGTYTWEYRHVKPHAPRTLLRSVDKSLIFHKPIRSAFSADPEQRAPTSGRMAQKAIDPSPAVTGDADQVGDVRRRPFALRRRVERP